MIFEKETQKIVKEVIIAQRDFIVEYGKKPNAIFLGIKQQKTFEKEKEKYPFDYSNSEFRVPFHPLELGIINPRITCIGMPVYFINEPDHISVGLMGGKVYGTDL